MRTSAATNKDFSDEDPELQVRKSVNELNQEKSAEVYKEQFISDNMVAIMLKSKKTAKDYAQFIILRQDEFQEYIKKEFGITRSSETDLEEEEADS